MTIAPIPSRRRFIRTKHRATRQRFAALSLVSGIAATTAAACVYTSVIASAAASPGPLLAGFAHRSYRPGQVAVLKIAGGATTQATLRIFLAGDVHGDAPLPVLPATERGWDKHTVGEAVTAPRGVRRPAGGGRWKVRIPLGADWPSGDYVARLTWPQHSVYAPFILRPKRLGTAPVLVIEPTNTWHAYDALDGDTWYVNPAVHVIDLTHPFSAYDIKGRRRVPAGLPGQFLVLDLGFLRWYWTSGYRADFFSDDDLENISSVKQLLRYRLIVFGGHEEYVTSHVYKLITAYRDAGGNLAFLSANNFFYKVDVHRNTMVGRTRWRDLGQPEASLVGAQYVGWNEAQWPNQPYRLVDWQAAPWLFQGTGLRNGATFGNYGIEIDEPNTVSPDHTHVLAEIPHEFGDKAADMTIYRRGRSTVFDAGALNFGASAHWGTISRMISNLWSHLSGESPGA